jgi:hypothetical protein
LNHVVHEFQASRDEGDRGPPFGRGLDPFAGEGDDLPYKVEVWDDTGVYPERVVAVSANPSIGYAAYYAAAREFPGRVITLRHRGEILSRWTVPKA